MTPLLDDLLAYIKSSGLTASYGIDGFVNYLPDTDAAGLFVLTEYDSVVSNGAPYTLRFIQFMVRHEDPSQAYNFAWDVFDTLCAKGELGFRLPSGNYVVVTPRQTPFKLEVDTRGRTVYVFNFGVVTGFESYASVVVV